MELILKEIERALDAKLYYLALQASLTLPDICGALQSDDGVAKNYKYIAWYDTYAKEPGDLSISGKDCYHFRCSYVHQALTTHEKSSYSRIIFLAPTCQGITFHNNVIDGALNIDVKRFAIIFLMQYANGRNQSKIMKTIKEITKISLNFTQMDFHHI